MGVLDVIDTNINRAEYEQSLVHNGKVKVINLLSYHLNSFEYKIFNETDIFLANDLFRCSSQ